ncbi:hypothetical protein GYMLUDRAFT_85025 [Collybiopsis luxurians FD-317 M1]|uniref:Peptide hydrolase n=1 Tax=Collybiopsis luxurians FD-317 M1 TaxID=944289 RepID=A0A0D0CPZ5_9AGAR|nr:hypothetical protein GYMLUDRAFT_85025 [Collybiopsis luxurians FD-317 M1]
MSISAKIRTFFARITGFLTLPVTTVLVLVYLAVTISSLVTDQLRPVPSKSTLKSRYGGLDVSEAYDDLHIISTRPHPYHSHANDALRNYLLRRVRTIRAQSDLRDSFLIYDDVTTSGAWTSAFGGTGSATYFQGNNILVKIRGTAESDSSTPPSAVLFSAHFDCVSTSMGTTDAGMGVATLLQLIKYFATHPPRRTVLFNINNGEEDGLNGAHAFLDHPWINNRSHPEFVNLFGSTFINLEGAGSGGRPLMFRATDLRSVKSWKNVDTPHANIISAEAFNLGIIRSYTDYSVYTSAFAVPKPLESDTFAPLRGLDFAFYRGRSKYHTKFDSIPFLEGGDQALWAMMEPTWAAGVALANDETDSPLLETKAVFLELFNAALIAFPLTYLLTFNITALVVGPISLILLAVAESALARSRAAKRQRPTFSPSVAGDETESSSQVLSPGGTVVDEPSAEPEDHHIQPMVSRSRWIARRPSVSSVWKHGRFWIALILGIAAQAALVAGFVNLSPFVVYGYPSIPILSSFTFAILILSLVLSPTLSTTRFKLLSRAPTTANVPAWTSFRTLLVHGYIFTWILVLIATVSITQFDLGGIFYMASICNGLLWLSAVICAIAGCFGIAETAELEVIQVSMDDTREPEPAVAHADDEHEANERTPLVGRKRLRIVKNKSKAGVDPVENPQPYVLWILLLLLIVPVPLILVSHMAIFLIPSVNQTLIDGSPVMVPYAVISLLSFIASLPAIPFIGARRVHRYLLWILGFIWVVCIGIAWIPWSGQWAGSVEGFEGGLFPFSEQAPLKVFFQQKVQLSSSSSPSAVEDTNAKVVTTLVGPVLFLERMILPYLPSYLHSVADGREVRCSERDIDERKVGLGHCSWETFNAGLSTTTLNVNESTMIPVPSTMAPSTAAKPNKDHESTSWTWKSTKNPWFEARVQSKTFNSSTNSSSSPSGARFFVAGNNSRACRVYFDRPIHKFRVQTIDPTKVIIDEDAGWEVQRGYESDSYNLVRLWSREWDRTFVLDVQWGPSSPGITTSSNVHSKHPQQALSNPNTMEETHSGRVACEWVEYESGMIGMSLSDLSSSSLPFPGEDNINQVASGSRMPAFEEVLAFLPKWAAVSKLTDGLVEVEEKFEF